MPFRVDRVDDEYKLYNLETKQYTKRSFKSRQAANNMKKVYMSYDKKKKTTSKKKKSTYNTKDKK